ncbi:hypothetical protein Taro_016480 [Colocasia esculenta]|uniref:BED-type domain-containing protein n=1 Tax=Colocasia esculenta TaxID=4460 RepID=A0A843UKF9_COLES|nr:hypothetical protein [Colocasia esculenta]
MAEEGHEEGQGEEQSLGPQLDIGVQCNHCGKEMNGGVYRLKQHIAGIGGNVSKCKQCPRQLVNEMKEYMAGRQQQKGIRI